MKRKPLSQVRSEWEEADAPDDPVVIAWGRWYERRVGDGLLLCCVALEPQGWHLSISFRDHRGQHSRYPRWDEIADARYKLVSSEVTMGMVLPPPEDYVALHDTTFHLHEWKDAPI